MAESGFTITKRDKAIAKYIEEKNLHKRITDDRIWINIAQILMLDDWKELKDRFLNYVVPNLGKHAGISNKIANSLTHQLCNQPMSTRSRTNKNNQASESSVCFDSCYESHKPVSPPRDNYSSVSLNVNGCSSRNSGTSHSTQSDDNLENLEIPIRRTKETATYKSPSQLNHKKNKILDKKETQQKSTFKTKHRTAEENLTNATEDTKNYMWPCCDCLELNELCADFRNHIFKKRCEHCNTKQIIEIGSGVVKRIEVVSPNQTKKAPADTIETVRNILLPDVSHYEYFF